MKLQDDSIPIQNHTKQTCSKGDHDGRQHQIPLRTQLLAIGNSMNKAQQQKQNRSLTVPISRLSIIIFKTVLLRNTILFAVSKNYPPGIKKQAFAFVVSLTNSSDIT